MQHIYTEIDTPIGIIKSGRDAIYVDEFEQKNNSLIIKGVINSRFCLPEYKNHKWYSFQLILNGVKAYKCENIEIYPWKEWRCNSALSEVVNSEWYKQYKLMDETYKHYILETYDYIYFVLCRGIEISITGQS